jgi:putative glutamine amidotransferase
MTRKSTTRVRADTGVIAVIVKSQDPKVLRDVNPYLKWLIRGGGTPAIVLVGKRIPPSAQGVLLLGGEDVEPDRYGETNRHCERINEPRDVFELDLLSEAIDRDRPILAVCRGIQVLAVAMGGTLFQDIVLDRRAEGGRSRVLHRGPQETDSTHRVILEPGTLLAGLIGRRAILVNSHHHQAVRKAPAQLRISARAMDGTIEAIEHRTNRFVLGVQWHPERWAHPSSDAIMKGFLRACVGE